MNATSVKIVACTSETELFRLYDGQFEPQDCYIAVDLRDGTIWADYDPEIGNARPFEVHYGFVRRYPIPILTGAAANRVLREIVAPRAERMIADWEKVWDGNNMIARLGADAQAAEQEIEALLGEGFPERDLVQVWDLSAAVNGDEVAEFGISADTTDERLAEIEAEILAQLADCCDGTVAVCPGLLDYLTELRDELSA